MNARLAAADAAVHRARPRYTGKTAVERDIANLKAALKGKSVVDVFMPAVSPGQIFPYHVNRHYKSDEEFLIAIGEAWARMPE